MVTLLDRCVFSFVLESVSGWTQAVSSTISVLHWMNSILHTVKVSLAQNRLLCLPVAPSRDVRVTGLFNDKPSGYIQCSLDTSMN